MATAYGVVMATSDRPAVGVDHPTVVPTNLGESDEADAGADADASAGADAGADADTSADTDASVDADGATGTE